MLTEFTVGLFAGLGAAAWVFNKMQHNNGNQTRNSLIVALAAGIALLILVTVLLNKFLPSN